MKRILVIQTAFIGDVVLATPVLEKLQRTFPDSLIDILVRGGNETLFTGHPFLNSVLVWEKRKSKHLNLVKVISQIRKFEYDAVINLQRFASTGIITALSRGKYKAGFDKNPFSFLFNHKAQHNIGQKGDLQWMHEVDRNLLVLKGIADATEEKMALYPSKDDLKWAENFQDQPFITISPASVWFTKQVPAKIWLELIRALPNMKVVLLGGKGDREYCESIRLQFPERVVTMSGELTFLRSAALMKSARMNFVNDSAPLHFASAVDAPVTAVFCSTIPEFGFGPRSSNAHIVQYAEELVCKPCGLHGRSSCPLVHFKCSEISIDDLLKTLR